MRTIQTARRILSTRPVEALNDAVGVTVMVLLVLAGFLAPVFV